jgi:integrase
LRANRPLYGQTLDEWCSDPVLAYESYLSQSPDHSPETRRIYTWMIRRFIAWVTGTERTILQITTAEDVVAFLEGQVVETQRGKRPSRNRRQYLRVIEDFYDQLPQLGHYGNPARAAGLILPWEQDESSAFLSRGHEIRLTRRLQEMGQQWSEPCAESDWLNLRDHVIVALILGAGLKVSEVRALTLSCIEAAKGRGCAREWINVPDGRAGSAERSHRAKILPFAQELIGRWCQHRLDAAWAEAKPVAIDSAEATRQRAALASKVLVIPGLQKGERKNQRLAPTTPMHAASIHRRTSVVLEAAGVPVYRPPAQEGRTLERIPRMCAQTLRNTYLAMLVDAGKSFDEVTGFLGFTDGRWARRLLDTYERSAPAIGRTYRPRRDLNSVRSHHYAE